MAGRVSAILRLQVEVAEPSALQGASAALRGARTNLLLALDILGNQLQSIEVAAARHDLTWLAGTYPDWVKQRTILSDELRELRRLLEHIDAVPNAAGMSS
jgi:hypothetical protein